MRIHYNFINKIRILLLVVIAFFAIIPELMAQNVPTLRGRVNDYAGILSDNTRSSIETKLKKLEQDDSTQVAVLTISSLEGGNLEEFSMRVAKVWKIGQAGKDNGVIFTIAKNDRKMRIEVGYGLEGVLTDAIAGRILDNIARPAFKEDDYNGGIEKSIDAIIGIVKGEFVEGTNLMEFNIENLGGWGIAQIVICLLFFILFIRYLVYTCYERKQYITIGILFGSILSGILFAILEEYNISYLYIFLFSFIFGLITALLPSGEKFVPKFLKGAFNTDGYGGDDSYSGSGRSYSSDYDSYSGGGGDYGGGGSSSSW